MRDDVLEYWLDYSTGMKTSPPSVEPDFPEHTLFSSNLSKSTLRLPLFEPISSEHLKQFGEVYCDVLNSVYEDFHPLEPLITDNYICFPFYIGEKPSIEWKNKKDLEKHLTQLLVRENPRANLRMIRIMRLYEGNVIYLIKPKQLRYWLRSIAIRDADETFAYLVAQEYQL